MKPFFFVFASMAAGLFLNSAAQSQTTSGTVPVDITGRFGSVTPVTLFSAPNATYEAKFLVPGGDSQANFVTGAFSFTLNGTAVNATTAYFSAQNGQFTGSGPGNGSGQKALVDFEVGKGKPGGVGFVGIDFYLSGPGWLATSQIHPQPSYLIPGTYTLAGFKLDPNRAYVMAPGLGTGYPPGVNASLSSNQIIIGSPVPEPSTLGLFGVGGLALLVGTMLRGRAFRRKPKWVTPSMPGRAA